MVVGMNYRLIANRPAGLEVRSAPTEEDLKRVKERMKARGGEGIESDEREKLGEGVRKDPALVSMSTSASASCTDISVRPSSTHLRRRK